VEIRPFGSEIRYHADFTPAGVNVNVAQIDNDGLVHVRTYERGVEDETLACGTGGTAVGIVSHLIHNIAKPVRLQVAGGSELRVDFDQTASGIEKVTLTGPATTVFAGKVEIGA
jgi:diaminopimelate epimerase